MFKYCIRIFGSKKYFHDSFFVVTLEKTENAVRFVQVHE
jgi:hypothetical protein